MKIFIDFDDVLFNTKRFKEDYFKIFKKKGVSKKIFKECYFDPLDNRDIKNYDPMSHIKRVCERIKIDVDALEKEIENFTADTGKYVFSDVAEFLDKFEKKELDIISFSITNFQKAKVYNSGLTKFFSKVKIVDSLKGEIILKIIKKENLLSEKDVYFVDDRVEQIENVKKICPQVTTILCSRREGRYRDRKNKYCDYKIAKLKEVGSIIKRKF
ncbi:MAG: hypothetical protein ACD_15C00133G0024 [uncultured bacterium]|nr:MAG: hypothetical protein ACD_15C00133G0024 [uncultured bacterium]HCU70398.1 hypothetical protein [Candidatus Moranbacteria bacterium]